MGTYPGLSDLEFLSFADLRNTIVLKCQKSHLINLQHPQGVTSVSQSFATLTEKANKAD